MLLATKTTASRSGRVERIPVERYQWPAGAALLLVLGAMVVNRGAE